MAKQKKKNLPKDIEARLESESLSNLKALYEIYDVNARSSVMSKQTTLAFSACPDDLARWLVERGAEIDAVDAYGETPLRKRAGHWKGRIAVLLELGANPNSGENLRGTPLHNAVGVGNVPNVRLLLEAGARVNALDRYDQTPLASALQRCSNSRIAEIALCAEVLIKAGAQLTPEMKTYVTRIGTDFEFHRDAFNPEHVDEASAGLDQLYRLFDVPPVPRRRVHDGSSPIVARSESWEDRHEEFWTLLVPSNGHAATVQGEVVRISGRIANEIDGNGGVNWDGAFNKMADAFASHLASGNPLSTSLLEEVRTRVAGIKRKDGGARRLCELAVTWVLLNPIPMKLNRPDYRR